MFLALDQGTTSSRAIVFAADGTPHGLGQREFAQHFPAPGLVEHDAQEILDSQLHAAKVAIVAAGSPRIEAVGITNQRETVVVWERATGRPIHPAIVWQDRRTAPALQKLQQQGSAARVLDRTGLPLDPYFSAAKIAWILDQVPGARRRSERGELCAGTIDSWLVFRLTAGEVFATDASNASRTSLFDLERGDWSDELCELFAVPRACLARVQASASDFGTSHEAGWPLRAVLGDQQAALFGHGCIEPGQTKCTYGTGAFVLSVANGLPTRTAEALTTVAWRLGDHTTYAREGSVLICGAAVQWLRDSLGILKSAGQAEAMARSVPDTGGVVFVPAFAGLGTPYWDASARGLLVGLTRGTTPSHIVRATLEAMALQVDDVLQALGSSRGGQELHVDGGAAANGFLLELQAALLGAPLVRPALLEATAFGAFRMSLIGARVVEHLADLPRLPGEATVVAVPQGIDVSRMRSRWRDAVQRARGWV